MTAKIDSVQKRVRFLKIFKRLTPPERIEIISKLSEDGVNLLSELVFNTLYSSEIPMTKKARKNLRKKLYHFESDLRFIAEKSKPYKLRAKKLQTHSQHGGAVSAIIAAVLPAIISAIASRMSQG